MNSSGLFLLAVRIAALMVREASGRKGSKRVVWLYGIVFLVIVALLVASVLDVALLRALVEVLWMRGGHE